MRKEILFVCCIYSATLCVESARILGIFPMPSVSHQVVFRALTLELAKRGHELVVITPNPALPKERPPDNITEIDTGVTYEMLKEVRKKVRGQKLLKRGIIMDTDATSNDDMIKGFIHIVMYQMELPEVKNVIDDETQKFDLVIIEAILYYPLIAVKKFNAPVIMFSSFYGTPQNYATMGAIACHPLYYPSFFRTKFRGLSLWEKLHEIYMEFKMAKLFWRYEMIEDYVVKMRYGPDAPTIFELRENIQLFFINSYPIIANNRPVPPSMIFLGGLHLQPVKELPEDLKAYLDNSSRGVVYVSLGTNVHPSAMDKEFLDAFLDAFESLPYDVLWKYDGDGLERKVKNLKTQKWFPQRDLLMHPNIKVFVTQCGMQSTDEAIDAGVPLVGIPMLGDQYYNAYKYEELGIGARVVALTMTAQDLASAIRKVIDDDSYKKNMVKLRMLVNDQPQKPLERAVWWTEHLLRHGNAKHLRAASANVTWLDYLMADVVAVLLASTMAIVTLTIVVCRQLLRLYRSRKVKAKQS